MPANFNNLSATAVLHSPLLFFTKTSATISACTPKNYKSVYISHNFIKKHYLFSKQCSRYSLKTNLEFSMNWVSQSLACYRKKVNENMNIFFVFKNMSLPPSVFFPWGTIFFNHQINQKLWKLIDLMMFGMQFFANFKRNFLLIFLKGIDNKISDFKWIQIRPPKSFFLYVTPLRKINTIFVSKLAKNCIPNIIKSINFDSFWSIWWCLVCSLLSILKQKLYLFYSRVWRIKKKLFGGPFWIQLKSDILLPILLRKISKKFLLKLAKNSIPNIIKSINFHSFWSIWWCLFGNNLLSSRKESFFTKLF